MSTTAEAFLIGTQRTDDFYRVRVPEGASKLAVDVTYAVTNASVAVFPLGEDPYNRTDNVYAGGSSAPSATLELDVTPGDTIVAVQKWEGGATEAWASRTDDYPSRPAHWDTPYTLMVSAN